MKLKVLYSLYKVQLRLFCLFGTIFVLVSGILYTHMYIKNPSLLLFNFLGICAANSILVEPASEQVAPEPVPLCETVKDYFTDSSVYLGEDVEFCDYFRNLKQMEAELIYVNFLKILNDIEYFREESSEVIRRINNMTGFLDPEPSTYGFNPDYAAFSIMVKEMELLLDESKYCGDNIEISEFIGMVSCIKDSPEYARYLRLVNDVESDTGYNAFLRRVKEREEIAEFVRELKRYDRQALDVILIIVLCIALNWYCEDRARLCDDYAELYPSPWYQEPTPMVESCYPHEKPSQPSLWEMPETYTCRRPPATGPPRWR
jgi:hypothetical protein